MKNERNRKNAAPTFFYISVPLFFSLSLFLTSDLGRVVEPLGREPLVDLRQDGPEALEERRERGEHPGLVAFVAVAVVAAVVVAAIPAAVAAPGDGREEGRARRGELFRIKAGE